MQSATLQIEAGELYPLPEWGAQTERRRGFIPVNLPRGPGSRKPLTRDSDTPEPLVYKWVEAGHYDRQ